MDIITISDHFLVYSILNLKLPKVTPATITTRSYKSFDPDAFCHDISNAPWDIVVLTVFFGCARIACTCKNI